MSERPGFDKRANSLRQVGDVIAAIATQHNHVDVDEITRERWRQLMGLMREVDTFVDTRDLDINRAIRRFDEPASLFADRYPALFPDQMDQESFEALKVRALSIIHLGHFAATTHNLDHFISYRTLEAKQATRLLKDSATPFVRNQPAFTDSFMPFALHCAISANFYDSFVDAKWDYEHNRIKIKPDHIFYERVGALALKHFTPLPGALFHTKVLKQFAPMAAYGITNKLRYDEDGNLRFQGKHHKPTQP